MAKGNKKQIASKKQNPLILLAMGLVLALVTYGLASWSIDSGAIPLYIATFVGVYMTIRTIVGVVKTIIRN